METSTVTLTLPNLTHSQASEVLALLGPSATESFTKARKTKKTKPEPTITDEDEEELEASDDSEDEEETSDEEESDESDSDEEEEDEEDGLEFSTVKDAINKYGAKKPEKMKAILLSFNFKSTKELQNSPKKWEPVYRKVQAALKLTKKAK